MHHLVNPNAFLNAFITCEINSDQGPKTGALLNLFTVVFALEWERNDKSCICRNM